MIRILAIEDHLVALTGLRYMFRPSRDGIDIAQTAFSVDEAFQKVPPGSFDMVLLDLWLGKSDPVENVIRLREHFPGKPVVIFTMDQDVYWQKLLFEAGIHGYILKSVKKQELKNILERVSRGEVIHNQDQNKTMP